MLNNRRKGITLMELMLSLSVIAVILVMATRYYNLVHSQQQVSDTFNKIQTIRSAAERWLTSHPDYTGMNTQALIARNLIPAENATNAWGGNIAIDVQNTSPNQFTVTVDSIPLKDCNNLVNQLKTQAVTLPECITTVVNQTEIINFKADFQ